MPARTSAGINFANLMVQSKRKVFLPAVLHLVKQRLDQRVIIEQRECLVEPVTEPARALAHAELPIEGAARAGIALFVVLLQRSFTGGAEPFFARSAGPITGYAEGWEEIVENATGEIEMEVHVQVRVRVDSNRTALLETNVSRSPARSPSYFSGSDFGLSAGRTATAASAGSFLKSNPRTMRPPKITNMIMQTTWLWLNPAIRSSVP